MLSWRCYALPIGMYSTKLRNSFTVTHPQSHWSLWLLPSPCSSILRWKNTWDRVGLIMPAPCCAIIELSVQKIFVLDICTFMRNKVTRKYFFKQIPWSNESAFPLRNLFLPMISWPRKRIYGLIIDLLLSPFLSGLERHYPSFLQWILADIATNDEGIDTFTSIFCFPPTEGVPRIRSVTKN